MKGRKDDLEQLFNQLDKEWNFKEPQLGHQERFLNKIKKTKKNPFNFRIAISVAASIIILIGFYMSYNATQTIHKDEWTNVSPQIQETHFYFTSIINKELKEVKKHDTPENKTIIEDATKQMQQLDNDYEQIKTELIKNGENKQLIYAMLTNLKTRISFLEEVLLQIENNNNLKDKQHEKNII